ncbi:MULTISPECIES: PRC-barrel domain-containing protein [unclassified Anabaena]|uniref:PRC-barrel domain-containing protein n=1 Tax=unclassified Anabaena TaxID=2619674 RepID=UPI00083155B9|nr:MULTISPECIES: PRC-barrel domain-containing protein [unclassified Anabaena]
MALYKLDEYYPDYSTDLFDGYDIKTFDVYAENDKVGSVQNVLVDETDGSFRYFIIDTGFWVFGKKVLLPVGLARLDYNTRHVYVPGLTKQQVEDLPEFSEDLAIDREYEERVRGVYRPTLTTVPPSPFEYDIATYNYRQEPYFYDITDPRLRSYQQRLIDRRGRPTVGV